MHKYTTQNDENVILFTNLYRILLCSQLHLKVITSITKQTLKDELSFN